MNRYLQIAALLVLLPLGGLAAARSSQAPSDPRALGELARDSGKALLWRLQQPWVLALFVAGAAGVAGGAVWRRRASPRPVPVDGEEATPLNPNPDRVEALGLLLWVVGLGGAVAHTAYLEAHHATAQATTYADPIAAGPRADGAVHVTRRPDTGNPAYLDSESGAVTVRRDGQALGTTPLSLDSLCTPGEDVELRFTQPHRQPAVWRARCEGGAMLLFSLKLER